MSKESSSQRTPLKWGVLPIFILLVVFFFFTNKEENYQSDTGRIFGTEYHVTYCSKINYKVDIEKELRLLDGSVSMYNDTSVISKVNRNEKVILDEYFLSVFNSAEQISKQTSGAFDATVAPLVDAWGFGRKGKELDSVPVDSILQFVGYQKIRHKNNHIVKSDSRVTLDFSAIAKGYAADMVARLLDRRGVSDYMVEIGGEIVTRGKAPKQENNDERFWQIGISKPVDDSLSVNQSLQTIFRITGKGMATSGNYRKFYYKNGRKYAHTIDPKTGYPVQHSLLSATVIAADCMRADAYATAFMVMGVEKAKVFAEAHPDIEAYFVYVDKQGRLKVCQTQGIKKYLPSEEEE